MRVAFKSMSLPYSTTNDILTMTSTLQAELFYRSSWVFVVEKDLWRSVCDFSAGKKILSHTSF